MEPISDEELDAFLLNCEEFIGGYVEQGIEIVPPLLFFLSAEPEEEGRKAARVVPLMSMPEEGRAEMMHALGGQIAREPEFGEFLAAAMIVEAWAKKLSPAELAEYGYTRRPSEYADRQEVVVVDAASLDGRHANSCIPISRNAAKQLILGEPKRALRTEDAETANQTQSHLLDALIAGWMEAREG